MTTETIGCESSYISTDPIKDATRKLQDIFDKPLKSVLKTQKAASAMQSMHLAL